MILTANFEQSTANAVFRIQLIFLQIEGTAIRRACELASAFAPGFPFLKHSFQLHPNEPDPGEHKRPPALIPLLHLEEFQHWRVSSSFHHRTFELCEILIRSAGRKLIENIMQETLTRKRSKKSVRYGPEDSEQRNIASSPTSERQQMLKVMRPGKSSNLHTNRRNPLALPMSITSARVSITQLGSFKLKWAMKRIVRKLRGLSAQQLPEEREGIVEEWEKDITGEESDEQEESKFLLHHTELLFRVLQLLITFIYLMASWSMSVNAVFGIGGIAKWALAVWALGIAIDILTNVNTVRVSKDKAYRTRSQILRQYLMKESYLDLAMITYLIASQLDPEHNLQIGLSLTILLVLIVKLNSKSKLLRTYFDLKKYMVMVDSFMLLMVVAHISVSASITQALLLFLSSNFAPERNWLRHINIQDTDWGIKYIYSLYWSVTTIVTVGYGDITPQNEYEVIVTIFIELTGSALFGYIINVIGMTMTELKQSHSQTRKEKQNLYEELSIAENLIKCLSLKQDLAYRLKSFLKNNQKADSYFSLKDEKRIWDKLKPDLKQQILQETNIRVIKKCLFFLTYFSRNFQDTIALKLLKRVFQPNEILGFENSNHNLYIIDQGKADLQLVRHHFNKPIYRTLRVINKERKKCKLNISFNLFGFTAMVLRRPVNLTAQSKQFITTYELQEKDFYELVRQYPFDFETVSQLRDSILHNDILESFEGPELLDNRLHFVPLKYHIIRRYNRKTNQKRMRKGRTENRRISGRYESINSELMSENDDGSMSSSQNLMNMKMLTEKPVKIVSRFQSRDFDQVKEQFIAERATEVAKFEQVKTYSKYFTNSNIQTVLKRFNPIEKASTKRGKRLARNEKATNLLSLRQKTDA